MPCGPANRWPIWLLTGLIIVGFPATAWVYLPMLLASGALPPSGDTIAIPLAGSVLAAALATPLAAIFTWFGVRNWRGARPLLGWRTDKPATAATAAAVFGLPAMVAVVVAALGVASAFGGAWYELVWLPWYLGVTAWLVLLRAAAGA